MSQLGSVDEDDEQDGEDDYDDCDEEIGDIADDLMRGNQKPVRQVNDADLNEKSSLLHDDGKDDAEPKSGLTALQRRVFMAAKEHSTKRDDLHIDAVFESYAHKSKQDPKQKVITMENAYMATQDLLQEDWHVPMSEKDEIYMFSHYFEPTWNNHASNQKQLIGA